MGAQTLGNFRSQHAGIVLDDIVVRDLCGDLESRIAGAFLDGTLSQVALVVALLIHGGGGSSTSLGHSIALLEIATVNGRVRSWVCNC